MNGNIIDSSLVNGTSCGPNIDPLWNHMDENGIIDGFDPEVETKEDLMVLMLLEKQGHLRLLQRSDDKRMDKVGLLTGSGSQSDGAVNFVDAVPKAHEKKWKKKLLLLVYVDQNGNGYGIFEKYKKAGLDVKLETGQEPT